MSGDFWSRRREAVAQEQLAEETAISAAEIAEHEAELAAKTDEELLKEAGLPAPEELDSAEAVRTFLSSTLPQRLKTRALRRLWRLNPVLANVDGLVDYGEDFTDSATVVENLQTAYQVGKGMLRHVEALAQQAEEAAQPELAEAAVEDDAEAPDAMLQAEESVVFAPPDAEAETDAEDIAPQPQRRMTFVFEEQRAG